MLYKVTNIEQKHQNTGSVMANPIRYMANKKFLPAGLDEPPMSNVKKSIVSLPFMGKNRYFLRNCLPFWVSRSWDCDTYVSGRIAWRGSRLADAERIYHRCPKEIMTTADPKETIIGALVTRCNAKFRPIPINITWWIILAAIQGSKHRAYLRWQTRYKTRSRCARILWMVL